MTCLDSHYMENYSDKPPLEPGEFYYSPEGFIVFTEKYLLKRGYCCQTGCRHCPYGYDKKTGKFKNENDTPGK